MKSQPALDYDPSSLPRELKRHYISASESDLEAMLKTVGVDSFDQLFAHIASELKFADAPAVPEELDYADVATRIAALADKNQCYVSFIGDGLPDYKVHEVVPFVASLRKLTTAYTPYQPERSQGTLISHWIYQCLMAKLTGFEAVNASLYERSTALFEAAACAVRMKKDADTVLVCESIHPHDLEVLRTLTQDNEIRIETVPVHPESGMTCVATVKERMEAIGARLAGFAFPQVNSLGILEDVNALTNLAAFEEVYSIAIIDPMLIATGGLKAPAEFGHNGCDIIVGEAQHLAIAPNFGGPGLGIFGVRHNAENKALLRATPGRFVGKTTDTAGRDCFVQVLSTREQHIRKDKATSNICSNQAFLATMAGASMLARGEAGMAQSCTAGHDLALTVATEILTHTELKLAFPKSAFYNEVTFELPESAQRCIEKGRLQGLHVGVDVSTRVGGESRHLLKVSFSDKHSESDAGQLIAFFVKHYEAPEHEVSIRFEDIPTALRRQEPVGLPTPGVEAVRDYYARIAELNLSPDEGIYPLGSCTMKYNPYLNDWAANLPNFTAAHPQAPLADVQGCLEVLYEVQTWLTHITGLAGVTTQPVAGAQGELVGLKLFQAYHRDHQKPGAVPRDVVLIPKSAHGTNFATAVTAGYPTKVVDGKKVGIVLLDADATGLIKLDDLDAKIAEYGERISCIMVTNPNTGGVFETEFKAIADKIHAVGGLVYMDGANMNAICGWVNLGAMGVDAVHNNLHKTWSIPHGGGGPGDGIVAVSEKLLDYLPGYQIEKRGDQFVPVKPAKSIGSFHRHWGNFAHKVRAYTYLMRLGREGVRRIAACSVLAARYLRAHLIEETPMLPAGANAIPRMHEFILTLSEADFAKLEAVGISKAQAMPNIGKVFLDFGYHAPTVAFPEPLGLMIEPTETYAKAELDRFVAAIKAILKLVREHPEWIRKAPYFTPVDRVDEVKANRNLQLWEDLETLPEIHSNRADPQELLDWTVEEVCEKIALVAQN